MKLIITLLVTLLGVLQYDLWFAGGGLLSTHHLRQSLEQQQQVYQQLEQRNQAMLVNIKQLKYEKTAIEARARNDLGMIKKGEIFYQIVHDES